MDLESGWKKITNLLICSCKYYEKFKTINLNKLHKDVTKKKTLRNVKLQFDFYCPEKEAYLFDNKGIVHTILIKD